MARRIWLWVAVPLTAAAALVATLPARGVPDPEASTLLQKLETRRGQPLTADQRRDFARISEELRLALGPPHEKFARALAQIFGLSPGQLQAVIPTGATMASGDGQGVVPRIEATLGRSISPTELQQLRIADNAMQAEVNEVLDGYAASLARVAGTSKEQVRRLFPAMGI